MEYIKILKLDSLVDLYKLILEGERIDIYFLSTHKNGTWDAADNERFISFVHYSDDYVMDYHGVVDRETFKFKSIKISNITEIKGVCENVN